MIRVPPISPLFPFTTLFRSTVVMAFPIVAGPLSLPFAIPGWGWPGGIDRKRNRLKSSHIPLSRMLSFFFNDTGTTDISPLSLHDALPIYRDHGLPDRGGAAVPPVRDPGLGLARGH